MGKRQIVDCIPYAFELRNKVNIGQAVIVEMKFRMTEDICKECESGLMAHYVPVLEAHPEGHPCACYANWSGQASLQWPALVALLDSLGRSFDWL